MAQVDAQVQDPVSGKFVPGCNAYQLRKRARDAITNGLLTEYDFGSPSAALMLPIIVQHMFDATRARRRVDRVRATNAARRVLAGIPRKRPETATRTLPQVLAHE